MVVVVNPTPRPLYPRERSPVPIAQEAAWVPGPVWTGAENLASPPGGDYRTVPHVASRYTDWALAARNLLIDCGCSAHDSGADFMKTVIYI